MTKGFKSICMLLAALLLLMPLSACTSKSELGTGPEAGGIPVDTVVMTIEGEDVLWEEMYYYLQNIRYSLEYYNTIEDWDAVYEGNTLYEEELTYSEFAVRYAIDSALERRAISKVFNEQGQELDEETYMLTKQDYMDYYSMDEEGFAEFIEANYMTENVFDYLNQSAAMFYNLVEILYGENGADVPQEEIDAYVESNSLVRAKHILLKTVDDSYEALPEEEIAAKRETADTLAAELQELGGDSLITRFAELAEQYNEDPGSDYYPDGYVYSPGTMVTAFEDAATALAPGQVSGVVESDYGYHIILRLPIDGTYVVYGGSQTLSYTVAVERTDSVVSTAQEGLDYSLTTVFEEMVPSEVFAIADAAEAAKAEAEESAAVESDAAESDAAESDATESDAPQETDDEAENTE